MPKQKSNGLDEAQDEFTCIESNPSVVCAWSDEH